MLHPRRGPRLLLLGPPPMSQAVQIASPSVGRALVRARMGARARVGLPPGGMEAGRAWYQGGLPPERAGFEGAGFWEAMAG